MPTANFWAEVPAFADHDDLFKNEHKQMRMQHDLLCLLLRREYGNWETTYSLYMLVDALCPIQPQTPAQCYEVMLQDLQSFTTS